MPLILLFGNGHRDRRITKAVLRKLRFREELYEPQIPAPGSLRAVVEQASLLLDKSEALEHTMLIVVDREHIACEEALTKLFREYFSLLKMEQLCEGYSWRLECRRGPRHTIIYVVAMGLSRRKCIEENLAKLIELTYGESIEADKRSLREWLRRRELSDMELVEKAPIKAVREAFKSLACVLDELNI